MLSSLNKPSYSIALWSGGAVELDCGHLAKAALKGRAVIDFSCPRRTGSPLLSPALLEHRLFQSRAQMFDMSLAPRTFSRCIEAALFLLVEAGMKIWSYLLQITVSSGCISRHLCLGAWYHQVVSGHLKPVQTVLTRSVQTVYGFHV